MDGSSGALQANIQVSESDIGQVKAGEPIQVTVPAYPNATFTGKILQVYPVPQVSSSVTDYTVIGSLNDPQHQLMAGMTASTNIQTGQASHVITIPTLALQQLGNLEGVYVYTGSHASSPSSSSSGTGSFGGGKGKRNFQGIGKGNGSGSSSGKVTSFSNSGGTSSSSASGSGNSGGFTGGSGFSGRFSSNLPKGVYFQSVQVGLFGATNVEITSGLKAGEQILLALPTSSSVGSATGQSGTGGGGFAFGRALGGGGRAFGGGGGGRSGG
jgi:HlyD family secretion protein